MKRYLVLGVLLATCTVFALARAAPRPRAPAVELTGLATPETAIVAIRWGPVTDARRQPVKRYLWELRSSSSALVAADSTTALADTARIARPAPGDSLIITAAVAARDTRDQLGAWGTSSRLVIPGRPWTPPAAPPVTADTVALGRPDSVWLVAMSGVAGDGTPIKGYRFVPGDTVDICVYAWKKDALYPGREVANWSSSNPLVMWIAGPSPRGPNCQLVATNPETPTGQLERSFRSARAGPGMRGGK